MAARAKRYHRGTYATKVRNMNKVAAVLPALFVVPPYLRVNTQSRVKVTTRAAYPTTMLILARYKKMLPLISTYSFAAFGQLCQL